MRIEETAHREKLFAEVGRLVVTFSNVENVLCIIFVTLTDGNFAALVKRFQYNTSFAEKLDLTDKAVLAKCSDELQAIWKPLNDGLQKYRRVRNDVAHKQMIPDVTAGKTHVEYFLRSPTYTPHRTEDHLSVETIHAAAVAVEVILKSLLHLQKRILG